MYHPNHNYMLSVTRVDKTPASDQSISYQQYGTLPGFNADQILQSFMPQQMPQHGFPPLVAPVVNVSYIQCIKNCHCCPNCCL